MFSTKNYINGDIITADAELNGCVSNISNAIILKINTKVDPVQINLDTATTTYVDINWVPVEGATGYLVSVNGQTYIVPNGANVNNLISHTISGLTEGQQVDVIVKSFNDTDTTLSSVFTTFATNCRPLSVDLVGSDLVCSGDSAFVSISSILPIYINTKWQNGTLGTNKTYKFIPLSTSTVKLELIDLERPGCIVSRNFEVKVNFSSTCNKTDFTVLDPIQVNLDTATTTSVTIAWDLVKDATGYLVSVNGQTYVIPNGENTGTELSHLISGLSPGQQVDVIVKSFNATDTTLSTTFTTFAQSCRGVDIDLTGTSIVCNSDSAIVQIASPLPSYFQTKWNSGLVGNTTSFKFKPLVTQAVKLEVSDSERIGCLITRFFTVTVDNTVDCKKKENNKVS